MGCDIHCYIEYRKRDGDSKNWSDFGGRINPGRNYGLFRLMAGVRGWGEGDWKLFEPKGLPEGLGYSAEQDNYLYITDGEECKCGESRSVTVETAKRWVESGSSEYKNNHSGKPTWVSHPDWHSHSWLSLVEYRQVLEKYKVVEQEDWERRERDRLDLIEKLKVDNSLGLRITEGNLLYELSEHYVEPKYHAILAAMDSFAEEHIESLKKSLQEILSINNQGSVVKKVDWITNEKN